MTDHLRRCYSCGHENNYQDNVLPACACVWCGSADTRPVKQAAPAAAICPICGCTDFDSCQVGPISCCWIRYESDLVCSMCAPIEAVASDPAGRAWLQSLAMAGEASDKPLRWSPCTAFELEVDDE